MIVFNLLCLEEKYTFNSRQTFNHIRNFQSRSDEDDIQDEREKEKVQEEDKHSTVRWEEDTM